VFGSTYKSSTRQITRQEPSGAVRKPSASRQVLSAGCRGKPDADFQRRDAEGQRGQEIGKFNHGPRKLSGQVDTDEQGFNWRRKKLRKVDSEAFNPFADGIPPACHAVAPSEGRSGTANAQVDDSHREPNSIWIRCPSIAFAFLIGYLSVRFVCFGSGLDCSLGLVFGFRFRNSSYSFS
jgi:hypothetical protein